MRIKEIRERKHIKQKELAKTLNILPTTLYKYEKGTNNPSCDMLIKIANALDVSVDSLLGNNKNVFDYDNLSNAQKMMIDIILDLDESTQQKALGYFIRFKEEQNEKH